jgi:molybdate transport system substrate-binding protein
MKVLWSLAIVILALGCQKADESAPETKSASPAPVVDQQKAEIRVAAASDLTPAFQALAKPFEQSTGKQLSFSFAATGLLSKQIGEGAPFDLFAAANESFVDDVVAKGACDGATKAPYAVGRVVLWQRKDVATPLPDWEQLKDPKYKHIAIANPEHAPYGKAAKQALEKLGLWSVLEPRIVYGENVKQAMQFAESGNAELALVGLALALASDGHFRNVDPALHAPIKHTLVVCKHGSNAEGGRAFAEYLNSPAGRRVLNEHGILLPDETAPVGSAREQDHGAGAKAQ